VGPNGNNAFFLAAEKTPSPLLIQALKEELNVGFDFSTVIGSAALLSVPSNPMATSFDLNNIDEHNFSIEHDASLSRSDYYLENGDNYSFNETIFNEVPGVL